MEEWLICCFIPFQIALRLSHGTKNFKYYKDTYCLPKKFAYALLGKNAYAIP